MRALVLDIKILADMGMAVLVWLVQLVIYPAFLYIQPENFVFWHARYTRRVSYVVLPLMLTQLVTTGYLTATRPSPYWAAQSLVVVALWALTFLKAVPLHEQLGTASDPFPVVRNLVRANWPRTGLWTLLLVMGLWVWL